MKAETVKAWQPLTFGGVARYAQDWIGRLIVTWIIVAVIVAGAVVWTVHRAWAPVIDKAISQLPAATEIRGGRLMGPQAVRLAENPFLSIAIDPRGDSNVPAASDFQVTMGPREIRFHSLFGFTAIPYQPQWAVDLNPAALEAWWGAWRPAALAYLAIGTMVFLFVSWLALATLYTLVPIIVAFVSSRELTVWGSWKLSGAALMSGAIFQAIAIVLYGLGQLRVPEMLAAFVIHFVVGWVFLVGGGFRLPRDFDNPELDPPAKDPFEGEGSPLESDHNSSTETGDDTSDS